MLQILINAQGVKKPWEGETSVRNCIRLRHVSPWNLSLGGDRLRLFSKEVLNIMY